jgi:hypothetical protein
LKRLKRLKRILSKPLFYLQSKLCFSLKRRGTLETQALKVRLKRLKRGPISPVSAALPDTHGRQAI